MILLYVRPFHLYFESIILIKCDFRDVIKLLLSKREINVNDTDSYGDTVLTRFIKYGYSNDSDNDYLCPKGYRKNDNSVFYLESMLDLINSGADVNARSSHIMKGNLLMAAAKEGCVEIVKLLLNVTDIDVNAKDNSGKSALGMAMDDFILGITGRLWSRSSFDASSLA